MNNLYVFLRSVAGEHPKRTMLGHICWDKSSPTGQNDRHFADDISDTF